MDEVCEKKSKGAEKLKILYLWELMRDLTDATHGLTMEEIISYLDKRYEMPAERKSIGRDLKSLDMAGFHYEIIPGTKPPQYHLLVRDKYAFSLAELKMICDALQSSKFLSQAATRNLIEKFKHQIVEADRVALDRQVITTNRVKNYNNKIQENITVISKAINDKRQIKFKYSYYDKNKRVQYRKNGDFYQISPFLLIYTDEQYYLLAYAGGMRHFRVDRMTDCEVVDVLREGEEEYQATDTEAYTNYTFGMYKGQICSVDLSFTNDMMNVVIDRFGRDVFTRKIDEDHFGITVKISVSEQFYGWLCGLGKKVKVLGPDEVKTGYTEHLRKVLEAY